MNKNIVKIQLIFEFDCGECGSCEVDEILNIFEYEIEEVLEGYFGDINSIRVREVENV